MPKSYYARARGRILDSMTADAEPLGWRMRDSATTPVITSNRCGCAPARMANLSRTVATYQHS
jgi:hypothetical protein